MIVIWYGISIIKIRRSWDRLILIMRIPILVIRHLGLSLRWINFPIAWKNNYFHYKVCDEITYPLSNLKFTSGPVNKTSWNHFPGGRTVYFDTKVHFSHQSLRQWPDTDNTMSYHLNWRWPNSLPNIYAVCGCGSFSIYKAILFLRKVFWLIIL